AALEVRVQRNAHGAAHGPKMRQDGLERYVIVAPPLRPRESRARGGQGHKAEPFQKARAADVPGIGDDEASRPVELVKSIRHRTHATIVGMDRLFRYDDWANREEVSRLRAMTPPPPRALRILAHIAATQWLWLTRM